MQQIPKVGSQRIGAGIPMGAGVVDYLASAAEQRVWHVLRDENEVPSTATGDIQFFDANTPTARDGNVEKGGSLPIPQIFFVFGLTVRFETAITLADLVLLMDLLYWTVEVNNRKEFGPINTAHMPAGGGIAGAAATAVGGAPLTLEAFSNGMPSGQLCNWLPVPIVEKGGEVFKYYATVAATIAALVATRRVEMAQWGYLFRRAVSQ